MRIKIHCLKKENGCGYVIDVDLEFVRYDEFIQCPNCYNIIINPYFGDLVAG